MLNGDATHSRSRPNRPRETRNYPAGMPPTCDPFSELRPMASSGVIFTGGEGCAGRDQCAYESRGNRVRLTYLVGFSHFSASMARISVGLIFALLYRNLMAVCQIGYEPCPPLGRIEIRKYRRAKVFCQRWRMLMWLARFLLVMPQSSNLSGVSNDEST